MIRKFFTKEELKDLIALQFLPCHRKRERSLVIFDWQFPLCYRCMMMYSGYFLIPFLFIFHIKVPFFIGIVLNIPMLIDGITQTLKYRKSNNFLRFLTGLLSGVGQAIIVAESSRFLADYLMDFNF